MRPPKEFWEQLPLKSDSDLYDMLAHQDDYLPEALVAAKEELSKRNLTPDRVTQLEADAQLQRAAVVAMAQERLSWPMRILIFFMCAGIGGAMLALYYQSKGYKGKAEVDPIPWTGKRRN